MHGIWDNGIWDNAWYLGQCFHDFVKKVFYPLSKELSFHDKFSYCFGFCKS